MKLIEPKAELWSEEQVTPEEHIARCARVCYGHDGSGKDPKKLMETLVKSGHVSMLRHATTYAKLQTFAYWQCSDFINVEYVRPGIWYASVNIQFGHEHELDGVENFVSVNDFLDLCKFEPLLFALFRLTFCLTTQISTSRELNRVSPNNIAERSTRYCSSKDGLEICTPWWWNEEHNQVVAFEPAYPEQEAGLAWTDAEEHYQRMLDLGMKPEDARGILPLDTATKVVYTYSVREWQRILDLRYYGKTGKPHPNAKLIMSMVRDQINQFAKTHGIDYTV